MIGTPAAAIFSARYAGRSNPVAQIRLLDHFLEAARDRFEVVAGEAAVGRKAFGEDQQVAALLGPVVAVHREEAADVREAVLLRRHRAAVGEAEHLAGDLLRRSIALPVLALLDEPGVLREAAGVEKERLLEAIAQRADAAQVRQRHRLPAAGVVGDGHHDERHAIAVALEQRLERGEIDVALERMNDGRLTPFRDHQVARLGLLDLDVRARRVEVVVVRHDLSGVEDGVKQDALGGAALMRRDDVA